MKLARHISALLIVLSLALPQTSCVQNSEGGGSHTEVRYALSGSQSWWEIALTIAIYVLPLGVLFVKRYRAASAVVGICSVAFNLYFVSYVGYVYSSSLLIGWYINTLGAISYLFATVAQLWRWLMPNQQSRGAG